MNIPLATYRCQFNRGFTFADAQAIVPYLRDLGITDLYASPLFKAGPQSTHGYDTCGFDQLNPNLGTERDFDALSAKLKQSGMALLLDVVPNHMGSHSSNDWWFDLLEKGPDSKYAAYFDVNWDPPNPTLKNKILLPVLGDRYSAVLERAELQVGFEDGGFFLGYYDRRFPLSPESREWCGLGPGFDLSRLNGRAGDAASFDKLHQLIQRQHYRLAYWRVGAHEINYRRFFDVTDLVSVRVEDEEVFQAAHQLALSMVRSGAVSGLRVDHPDGLRDPRTYFERLQQSAGGELYVLAEKILCDGEELPGNWPIHGTTGYDYLNFLNGVFVRQEHEAKFTSIYSDVTGTTGSYASIAFQSKLEVLDRLFPSEMNSLTRRLRALAQKTREGVDFTEPELRSAIAHMIAGMPVYRTYVTESTRALSKNETGQVRHGLAEARKRYAGEDSRALDFLGRLLTLDIPRDYDDATQAEAKEFVIRFQQLSGPATAKGLEDTAFYRYARFVSLNEVGGNPGQFGTALKEFHDYNLRQQRDWPHTLLTTATHDTKRGEDVRARLNVLSEIPDQWRRAVASWQQLNAAHKSEGAPSRNDEYLLYQVLVGSWINPDQAYTERIQEYMRKAMREAKLSTSWTEPNEAYESAVEQFVARILQSPPFVQSISAFVEPVTYFGMFNSLAQLLCKITSPGVPDIYQGTELWDLSLVDPDNRRPVDYPHRRGLLAGSSNPEELLRNWKTGDLKLFTLRQALKCRAENRRVFERGEYIPLEVSGPKSEQVIAYARRSAETSIVVVAPRFVWSLTNGKVDSFSSADWGETRIEFSGPKRFRDYFTGDEHSSLQVRKLLGRFPVSLLLGLE